MRISDWSSDLCSSDLSRPPSAAPPPCRKSASLPWAAPHPGRQLRDDQHVDQPQDRDRCADHRIAARRDQVALPDQYAQQDHRDSGHPHDLYYQIAVAGRSEEHTSELQSLMRISYAVFCLKKKNYIKKQTQHTHSMTYNIQITLLKA